MFGVARAPRTESPWDSYDISKQCAHNTNATWAAARAARFMPVELWTGAPWDGTQAIHMAPAALEFGQHGDKSIKGPTSWNGIQVYERLNRDKLQRFAIRDDQTGLGASSTRAIRNSAAAAR